MVVKCMQLFVILLSASLLGVVILSFSFAKLPELKQQPDRFTGYPTWHGKIKGYDPNQHDGLNVLTVILLTITGVIGARLVSKPPAKSKLTYFYTVSDDSDADATGVSTLGFNRLLVLYIWATLGTVFVAILTDVGKLWFGFGILHNAVEVVILVFIGSGGRIRNNSFLFWMIFYVLSIGTIVELSDFPNDAAFFKFQGLCMDFALFIEYVRIYFTTKEHIHGAERDTLPPLNIEEDNSNDNNDMYWPIFPTTIEYPKQIRWLLLASGIHLVGNTMNAFFFSYSVPLFLFELSYATTFPLYIYHIYLDTQAGSVLPQKRIYLPSTPTWKVIVITISSITLSALTMRLSTLVDNNS